MEFNNKLHMVNFVAYTNSADPDLRPHVVVSIEPSMFAYKNFSSKWNIN